MKDPSADMRPGKLISKKMQALLDKEKATARQKTVERGIVHFRADAEFMEALFALADKSKVAPGTLCRRIVWAYLESTPQSSIMFEGGGKCDVNPDEIIQRLDRIEALISKSSPQSKGKGKRK